MRSIAWPAALAVVGACSTAPLQPDVDLSPVAETAEVRVAAGESFVLGVGDVASVAGGEILVGFRAVRSDSRCPTDVTCVWAGDAVVEVGLARDRGTWTWHTLHTTLDPREASADGFRVRLVTLTPAPRTDRPIEQADYAAELRVDRI